VTERSILAVVQLLGIGKTTVSILEHEVAAPMQNCVQKERVPTARKPWFSWRRKPYHGMIKLSAGTSQRSWRVHDLDKL